MKTVRTSAASRDSSCFVAEGKGQVDMLSRIVQLASYVEEVRF